MVLDMKIDNVSRVRFSDLRTRWMGWLKIGVVALLSMIASHPVFLLLWTLISFLAFKEYLYFFVAIHWYGMFIILIPVYVFLFLPFCMILQGRVKGFVQSVGSLQWGLMLTTFSISHAAYLLALPHLQGVHFNGKTLLLFLLLLTQCNDIVQYVVSKWGGRQIAPQISPGKTWAGCIVGGSATIALAVVIAPYLTPLPWIGAALVGSLMALAGLVGDLIISAVKEDMGANEGSAFLPGRSGVLGWLNSLTYAAPLFFHTMYYFYY
jgi:phosphatidate cytidylyltransferase